MTEKASGDHTIKIPCGALKFKTDRAGIQQRHRFPNKRKYIIERRWGDAWYADGERWVTFERLVDHSQDLYSKRYVDQETGDVIYECEEPLSAHIGPESAKPE